MPRNKTFRKMKIKRRKKRLPADEVVELPVAEQIEELTHQAQDDITTFSYDSAIENCTKILSLDPENITALELLASVLMEVGRFDDAEEVYRKCVELCPNIGHEKYLCLAQLSEGQSAVQLYEKGITIIEEILTNDQEASGGEASAKDEHMTNLRRTLSDAFCSVAELYMTDLCDETDAEAKCEKFALKAIETDSSNSEAYQCYAGLKLTQGQEEEAKLSMTKSISFWLPQSLDDDLNEENIPEYDSRYKAGQMLFELEMYEEATQVFERLTEEVDGDFMVWYLLALSNYNHGDIYKENAYYYFKKAKEVGEKFGYEDNEEIWQELHSHLRKLSSYEDQEDESSESKGELELSSDSEPEMES